GPDANCAFGPPRVCVALLDAGAPCAPYDGCKNSVCDSAQAKCTLYGSLGADAGCTTDVVCAAGLYCKSGACAPRETLGGPCPVYGGLDCASAYTCLLDGGTQGSCAP